MNTRSPGSARASISHILLVLAMGVALTLNLRANPPPSQWQLITPTAAAQATGGAFFPMQNAFDGAPAWSTASATMTGTGGAADAPLNPDRYGYIDFGTGFASTHIMEMWTLYRANSPGNQSGFPLMWWDDDTDTINDNGVVETRMNFNSAQGLLNIGTTQWVRDRRANFLGGIIPSRRYLIVKSATAHTNRAQEFAMSGYVYAGLVPPAYQYATFLSVDRATVMENGVEVQAITSLTVTGGEPSKTYTLELNASAADNAFVSFDGSVLRTRRSYDFETKSRYNVVLDAVASDGGRTPLEFELSIGDVTGKWDTNGVIDAEIAAYYGLNVGDFVIWGATLPTGPDITFGNGTLSVTPPNKIAIKAGAYRSINLDLTGVAGTSTANRVPITNFLGQVYAKEVVLTDGVFWRLTGLFDAAAGLGHTDYRGCVSAAGDGDFGYSTGTYGIWVSQEWGANNMVKVAGTATGWEIDHIEVCDGGFAGLLLKQDSGTVDMNDVSLHHLYIHDTESEGIYLGSTQADPQHQFNNLTITDCCILRTGTEALQVGQLGANCLVRNCVLWGALDWLSPFQRFQDNVVQITTRQGGTTFQKNIVLGGGEQFYNLRLTSKAGITPNGNPIVIEQNVNWACRGVAGAYQGNTDDGVTNWVWQNNFFGGLSYNYGIVYPNPYGPSQLNSCVRVATNNIAVTTTANAYDTTFSRMAQSWASGNATLTQTANTQKLVVAPRFVNLLGPGEPLDFLRWMRWTATVGEDAGFTAIDTKKGDIVTFQVGDIVQHHAAGRTRFYRCLISNSQHEPPAAGDSTWQWITWTRNGRVQFTPPDDARLVEGSHYHQLGLGLGGNALADTDNDGLPNDWELRHGLNPLSAAGNHGAAADSDGDGRSNLDEYRANTHPTQPDTFQFSSITKSTGFMNLSVQPPAGRAWRIETSTQLNTWTPYQTWQPANGTSTTLSIPVAGDHVFFRLAVGGESLLGL